MHRSNARLAWTYGAQLARMHGVDGTKPGGPDDIPRVDHDVNACQQCWVLLEPFEGDYICACSRR